MAENKNLKEFMEKLEKGGELLKGLQEATNKDPENGAYKFALENSGGGFSEEEFIDQIGKLFNKSIKSIDKLDENILENVAGGKRIITGDNRNTVAAANAEGKWGAITAAINSLGSIGELIKTIGNIWATSKEYKQNAPLINVQIEEAELRLAAKKIEFMDAHGLTADQLELLMNSLRKG